MLVNMVISSGPRIFYVYVILSGLVAYQFLDSPILLFWCPMEGEGQKS